MIRESTGLKEHPIRNVLDELDEVLCSRVKKNERKEQSHNIHLERFIAHPRTSCPSLAYLAAMQAGYLVQRGVEK